MQNISVDEVKNRLNAGQRINLVDVREPDENAAFNIGGMLMPLGKIQSMQVDELEDIKEEEIVFYCRSGNRSGQACLILDMLGFKNTKNLTGGMVAWQEKYGDTK
jgi:rhodanese-related sulfurtransferase